MRRRPTLILAATALALVAAVQPAAAFTERSSTGTYYVPQVTDETSTGNWGVDCVYSNNSGLTNDTLKTVKLKRFFTHAPYASDADVGFRLQILRNGSPYYTSPLVRTSANRFEVAYFKASWSRPSGLSGNFKAVILLTFYSPQGVNKGSYSGVIDVYNHRLTNTGLSFTNGDPGDPGNYTDPHAAGYCHAKYPGGG